MYNPDIIENPGIVEGKHTIAIPPGETIKEQLYYRNMNQKEFALRMQLSEKHISKLLNGEVLLTSEMAIKLEAVLGVPSRFWSSLEANYRNALLQIQEEKNIASDSYIMDLLPYSEMLSLGWVPATNSDYEKVLNSRKFFEVLSLQMIYDPRLNKLSSIHEDSSKNEVAFLAWVQKAKLEARNVNTKSINIKKLNKIIPELKTLCQLPLKQCIPLLQEKLAECGIALIILSSLGMNFLHGATINDNGKLVMALTTDGKTNDQFWLSLFHEIGHIVNGDTNLKQDRAADFEEKADKFAIDYFFDDGEYSMFIETENFTKASIKKYAAVSKICEALIVNRLQAEGKIKPDEFNDLKIKC